MMQEDSGLFQVRLTEQGKKFIRKFAAISYTMLVLVVFEAAVSIYWNVRILEMRMTGATDYSGYTKSFYDKIYPYLGISFSILAVVSNIYYLRFPRVLLHSIKINDEWGANRSFSILFKGAVIFLCYLLLNTGSLIWSLAIR
jgi:hypothetical protein